MRSRPSERVRAVLVGKGGSFGPQACRTGSKRGNKGTHPPPKPLEISCIPMAKLHHKVSPISFKTINSSPRALKHMFKITNVQRTLGTGHLKLKKKQQKKPTKTKPKPNPRHSMNSHLPVLHARFCSENKRDKARKTKYKKAFPENT